MGKSQEKKASTATKKKPATKSEDETAPEIKT